MEAQLDRGLGRRKFLGAAASLAATHAALGRDYMTAGYEPKLFPGSIVDVSGIRVGHFTDLRRPTGCTVVLFDRGAVAGVDVRGSAPGTRETDLLNPINTVQQVNAIVLAGGSAYGLDAATGVMQYLEEHGSGYRVGRHVVPIVPAAILFDLSIGDGKIRPDRQSGYAACRAASGSDVPQGNVGAGAGATVGKFFGSKNAMKSGLGTASVQAGTELVVGAIVAVNAGGDVLDCRAPHRILAGARASDGHAFRNSMQEILQGALLGGKEAQAGGHTTIGIVATNAALSKAESAKIAQMAQDGLARVINPVHTAADGDTVFAAGTGQSHIRADVTTIGAVAAEVMARAINNAVLAATGIPGYPACRDLLKR
ncbi:MAG TPA: P1 family peptidase [Bryobacteraceae bacterium]|jgi:L-aminopeptidase/D-esterase-like protein